VRSGEYQVKKGPTTSRFPLPVSDSLLAIDIAVRMTATDTDYCDDASRSPDQDTEGSRP
jgi:hypothetical protein